MAKKIGKVNDGYFFPTFDEKIQSVENLILHLEVIRLELTDLFSKNPINFRKLNRSYGNYFEFRVRIIQKLTKLLNKDIDQNKLNQIVETWKKLEKNLLYGSYNVSRVDGLQYAQITLEKLNKFLKKLSTFKNRFNVDLDTNDKFVLTPKGDILVVPARSSNHIKRMKRMKEEHRDVDPYGEELWADEDVVRNESAKVRRFKDGKLEDPVDFDIEEEDDSPDPYIGVGDFVFIVQYGVSYGLGQVLRIFEHSQDPPFDPNYQGSYKFSVKHLKYDDPKRSVHSRVYVDLVIKFEGRNDLEYSRLSNKNDVKKFSNLKYNVYKNAYESGDKGTLITKMN